MLSRKLLFVLLLWGLATPARAIDYQSPVQRVTLLELFTSHGCSSCPPADAWLRRWVDHPDLWHRVIPIAFHVDYWDQLGWPDRFARARFSERQRAYRRSGAVASVYTPGFVAAGREWRGWFRGMRTLPAGDVPVGRLYLTLEPGGDAVLRFDAVQPAQPPHAHLVVLGFDLATAIGAGENAGRVLGEDFVALGMSDGRALERRRWVLPWPQPVAADPGRRAVVAWVSAGEDPAPLQAVGGWLP